MDTSTVTYHELGHCFDRDCQKSFAPGEPIVWLVDDQGEAYPFHPSCADAPWPMSEIDPPGPHATFKKI